MRDGEEKTAIIRMFHVYRHYGNKTAVVDITLDIYKNELLFINGPSGAGKTTLLKLLYLAEPVSDGQILVNGMNLSRIARKKVPFLRRNFGIVFQDYKLIPTKTVYENVALVLEAAGQKRRLINKKVKSVLRTVGMEQRINALPPTLSGGEQQRVAIARAVVGDPEIILADEPTGSLDAAAADHVLGLLRAYHTRGATVIIATHAQELIRKAGGRVVHLNAGRLVNMPDH
ncbi:MAG: cell division ATP-binding protein FtsE [Desulfobacterales bacterium]